MIVFGKKNYDEICESLAIPGIRIAARHYSFLPIYKVEINYDSCSTKL